MRIVERILVGLLALGTIGHTIGTFVLVELGIGRGPAGDRFDLFFGDPDITGGPSATGAAARAFESETVAIPGGFVRLHHQERLTIERDGGGTGI